MYVFGGAFNPPHLGHVTIARTLKTISKLGGVIVCPSECHKWNKNLLPIDDRITLWNHICPDIPASDIEKRNTSGRTFDLLEMIDNKNIVLVVGADQANKLNRWYRGNELIKKYKILCITRDNEPCNGFETLNIDIPESSTNIRNSIKQNTFNVPNEWNNDKCLQILKKYCDILI